MDKQDMVLFIELEWRTSVDVSIKSLLSFQTLIGNSILPSRAWSWTQQLKSFSWAHWSWVQSTGLFLCPACAAVGLSGSCCWEGPLDAAGTQPVPGTICRAQVYEKAYSQSKWWQTHPSAFPWRERLSNWGPTFHLISLTSSSGKISLCHVFVQELSRDNEAFWLLHNWFYIFFPKWLAIFSFELFWHQTGSPYQACITERDLPVFSTWMETHTYHGCILVYFFSVK